MRMAAFFIGILLAGITAGAAAQDQPLVIEQATLSDEGALRALTAASEDAKKRGVRVSIAVVDANGQLLAFRRIGNAFPATIDNAVGKASTAAQMGRPSAALQETIDKGRLSYLALQGLTPLRGGVPILVSGKLVGGIASSGAPPEVDESIATAGAEALARD